MSMTPSSSAAAETERRLGVLRGEILSAITQACQDVPFLVLDEIDPVLEACRPCIFKVVDIEHAAVAARARGMTQCYTNYNLTGEDIAALHPDVFAQTYEPVGERPKCRGIAVTVLQPAGASIDDYFAPLVDQALAEVAAITSDKLPHDGSEWTASNGVRLYVKLINETA